MCAADACCQLIYSAGLLFIPAVSLTKISMALFMSNIVPARSNDIAVRIYCAVVATWSVASLFAASFVCEATALKFMGSNSCFGNVS